MTSNHDSNPYPHSDAPKTSAYVKTARRDGKYLVVFMFPISGRRITKILTRDEIASLPAKGYAVRGILELIVN